MAEPGSQGRVAERAPLSVSQASRPSVSIAAPSCHICWSLVIRWKSMGFCWWLAERRSSQAGSSWKLWKLPQRRDLIGPSGSTIMPRIRAEAGVPVQPPELDQSLIQQRHKNQSRPVCVVYMVCVMGRSTFCLTITVNVVSRVSREFFCFGFSVPSISYFVRTRSISYILQAPFVERQSASTDSYESP